MEKTIITLDDVGPHSEFVADVEVTWELSGDGFPLSDDVEIVVTGCKVVHLTGEDAEHCRCDWPRSFEKIDEEVLPRVKGLTAEELELLEV